jgi:hypothetical protein
MKPIIVEINTGAEMTYLRVDAGRLYRLTSSGWQPTDRSPGLGGRVLTVTEQTDLETQWGRP